MKPYSAFLFDLNGTMIDDMHYHIKAWHTILNNLGASLTMEQMKAECYGKNDELLERIFPNRFTIAEKQTLSFNKEKQYQADYQPQLQLFSGLNEFLNKASAQNMPMAIGSAAIMCNINFVLDGLQIRHHFKAIVSADDVTHSKPNAETYLQCAKLLGVASENCIVFEDAPKGVEAAQNAGMKAVVITSMHPKEDFTNYSNILFYISDYNNTQLKQLL